MKHRIDFESDIIDDDDLLRRVVKKLEKQFPESGVFPPITHRDIRGLFKAMEYRIQQEITPTNRRIRFHFVNHDFGRFSKHALDLNGKSHRVCKKLAAWEEAQLRIARNLPLSEWRVFQDAIQTNRSKAKSIIRHEWIKLHPRFPACWSGDGEYLDISF